MPAGHYNILFLSNRNTARSIFAEAVASRLGQGHFKGFSAGMNPANLLDPLVVDILRVAQYPVDGLRPKHWQEFARADAPPLDFVFTLCDPWLESHCHIGQVDPLPPIGVIPILQTFLTKSGSGVRNWLGYWLV